jgi:TonB family protein
VLLAASRPARIADLARQTRPGPGSPVDAAKIEEKVFGPKKYYSMTLNMPNLSSSGGSCVVRFAQLHEDGFQGDLVAPVAMHKVDPAYPNELRRSGVEGTITLYAVIRSNGSVAEVRVLRGVDERLDENARLALAQWRFRPGTKNGSAVDLEAVVQIPFQARGARPF